MQICMMTTIITMWNYSIMPTVGTYAPFPSPSQLENASKMASVSQVVHASSTCTTLQFSDIYDRWDIPNQTNRSSLNFVAWTHAWIEAKQRTMVENSGMLSSSITFRCHMIGSSRMTGFIGRKAVIETITLPICFLLEQKSLGGQTVSKAVCLSIQGLVQGAATRLKDTGNDPIL